MQCSTKGSGGGCRPCRFTWLFFAAALAILSYQYLFPPHGTSTPMAAAGDRRALGELSLPDLDGHTWNLQQHRGKVVLVNFWASWCPPCRAETPTLARLAGKYAPRGLDAVGIALDEKPDGLRDFVAKYEIPYPVLRPDGSPLGPQITSVPVTLLIDRHGRIAKRYDGPVSERELSADIERLLSEA